VKDKKESNLDLEKINHALCATFAQIHQTQLNFSSPLISEGQQVATLIPKVELPNMVVATNQNVHERRLHNARNDLIQLIQETERERERQNIANMISPYDALHIPNMYTTKLRFPQLHD